jgi:D-alanyl-lipoteichoic acid acyltransferase DltB (MBOAT superfamily)
MLFNTIDFVVFFIIFLSIIYFVRQRKPQHVILLASSYLFFVYSSSYMVLLLVFTTLWDYYLGQRIYESKMHSKTLLATSLAGNLFLLGFFKYADFVINGINLFGADLKPLNLVLPIAISFYTFHSITYTVGLYRKQFEPCKSLLEYSIFVSFFPLLVAGPIIRAKDFLPQLKEVGHNLRQFVITNSQLKSGVTLMAIGFFKKMFIADNISGLVSTIFSNPIGEESFTIILGAITFGVQIYCDFSGYSDIAIGASKILGFKIPANFNNPYFAGTFSDFWKRWHISLSSWLRDYLYFGLGGNRKGKPRTLINLLIVMFLGGLWHGASLNFIVWGLLHGAYLAITKALNIPEFRFKKIISIILTQYFVFLAWIPFRVSDFGSMFYSMKKYIFIDSDYIQTQQIILSHKIQILLIRFFFISSFIAWRKGNLTQKIEGLKMPYWSLFLAIIILVILFSYNGNPEQFIYFRF